MSIPEGSSVKLSQQDVDAVFDEAQQIALKNVRPSGVVPATKKVVLRGRNPAGIFQPDGSGGVEHIGIHEQCPEPLFTALHEVAHVLDHQAHDKPGSFLSSERFGRVFELAKDTDSYSKLIETIGTMSVSAFQLRTMKDRHRTLGDLHGALRAQEVFARIFSQWVAKRSGDTILLEEFERARLKEPCMFWTDGEFSAISEAFEKYLRKIGWGI